MYNSTKFLHATNHSLFQCIDFKKYFKILKTNNMRIMQIQNKDCIHDSCRICDKKYNILLHVESKNRVRTTNILIVMDKEIMNETQYTKFIIFIYIKWNNNFIYSDNNCKESIWKRKVLLSSKIVILFTAIIIVKNQYGNAKYCCQHLNLNHIL